MSKELEFKYKENPNSGGLYVQYDAGAEVEITQFGSAYDLIQYAEYALANGGKCIEKNESDKGWIYGTEYKTKEATYTALSNGEACSKWIEMYNNTLENLQVKHPELADMRRSAMLKKRARTFADCGDELCIDRYMAGDTEQWSKRKVMQGKKAIKVLINCAASSGNNASKFIENICIYIALIDTMQAAGYCCEVHIGAISSNTTNKHKETWVVCTAKEANEPIDASRLLSFGAAGFFRNLIFSVYYNLASGGGCDNYGLGQPQYSHNTQAQDFLEYDLVIGGLNYQNGVEFAKALVGDNY